MPTHCYARITIRGKRRFRQRLLPELLSPSPHPHMLNYTTHHTAHSSKPKPKRLSAAHEASSLHIYFYWYPPIFRINARWHRFRGELPRRLESHCLTLHQRIFIVQRLSPTIPTYNTQTQRNCYKEHIPSRPRAPVPSLQRG